MENYKLGLYVTLAVVFGLAATSLTFFYSPPLDDFEEFQASMKKCEAGARYLNEETAATWRYKIDRLEGSDCIIEVTLLQPKVGSLETEELTGYSMECTFPRGVSAYPEKALDRCHGRLKEELQTIVISKLQTYVLDNLNKIDQSLAFEN